MQTVLENLLAIAIEAGQIILEHYARDFDVHYKGPSDPVTIADTAANTLICARLTSLYPEIPIVAEESDPATFAGYTQAKRILFVDPLDGTKEFIQRNDEFVVMLGLVEGARAVAGVVYAPVQRKGWIGAVGVGAVAVTSDGTRWPITASSRARLDGATLVASRSHRTASVQRTLDRLGLASVRSLGSAGLKGASVADGTADLYLSPGYAGKRWDACAIDALVSAAGGRFSDSFGRALDYRAPDLNNDQGLLATNGLLHDATLTELARHR
jgi:3'(2'), 5'-bisphosphate nucleotidase